MPWQIIIGRIALFYRVAQANTWSEGNASYTAFDRLITWIGLAFAPKEFQRADLRFRLLQRIQNGSSMKASDRQTVLSHDASFPPSSSSASVEVEVGQKGSLRVSIASSLITIYSLQYIKRWAIFLGEVGVWILKIGAWSCFWGAFCVLCMTFSANQRRAINQNTTTGLLAYGEDFDCGVS